MQHIISEIVNEDVPFIVIESAKKQYCELLGDSRLSGKMKVYSGGYDTTLLQINPFQPETGTILDNHIQSLVALFVSLFDEPAPLPLLGVLQNADYSSCFVRTTPQSQIIFIQIVLNFITLTQKILTAHLVLLQSPQ